MNFLSTCAICLRHILYHSCHLPSRLYRHATCSALSLSLPCSFILLSPRSVPPSLLLSHLSLSLCHSSFISTCCIPPIFPHAAQRSASLSPVASWAHPTGGPKRLSVLQLKRERTSNADPSSRESFFSEALTLKKRIELFIGGWVGFFSPSHITHIHAHVHRLCTYSLHGRIRIPSLRFPAHVSGHLSAEAIIRSRRRYGTDLTIRS